MPCCLRLRAIKVAPSTSLMLFSYSLGGGRLITVWPAWRGNPRRRDYAVLSGVNRGRRDFPARRSVRAAGQFDVAEGVDLRGERTGHDGRGLVLDDDRRPPDHGAGRQVLSLVDRDLD